MSLEFVIENFILLGVSQTCNQGKHAVKYSVCMGVQRQIISLKLFVQKNAALSW